MMTTPARMMVLNEFGVIAYNEWSKLPERFKNIELGIFQIMPNQLHAILLLHELTRTVQHENEKGSNAPTIGEIIGSYKSIVANRCLELFKLEGQQFNQAQIGKLWQRNYYEHIISNEQHYNVIWEYVAYNPARWEQDKFYVGAGLTPARDDHG